MKALSVHKLEKLDVVGRNIMTGNMIGFVIWAMVGVIIISLGIRAYFGQMIFNDITSLHVAKNFPQPEQ